MKDRALKTIFALQQTLTEIKSHVESDQILDEGAPEMELTSELAVASGYVHGVCARFRGLIETRADEGAA